jgi:hypothetical protein
MLHIQPTRMGHFFNINSHGHKCLYIGRPALFTSRSICSIIMCEGNSDLYLNISNVYRALATVLHRSSSKEISYQVQQLWKPFNVFTTTTPVCWICSSRMQGLLMTSVAMLHLAGKQPHSCYPVIVVEPAQTHWGMITHSLSAYHRPHFICYCWFTFHMNLIVIGVICTEYCTTNSTFY